MKKSTRCKPTPPKLEHRLHSIENQLRRIERKLDCALETSDDLSPEGAAALKAEVERLEALAKSGQPEQPTE